MSMFFIEIKRKNLKNGNITIYYKVINYYYTDKYFILPKDLESLGFKLSKDGLVMITALDGEHKDIIINKIKLKFMFSCNEPQIIFEK